MNPKHKNYKDEEYLNWIKGQPCLVTGQPGVDAHHVWHARNNDYLSVPLVREKHSEYHSAGHESFSRLYNADFKDEIINYLIKYIEEMK